MRPRRPVRARRRCRMLSLILAESAVEIVPESVRGHPAVVSSSRRLGRSPASTLLDVSWHHAAMGRLGGGDARRRGRPDIAHSALLAATGTPLYAAGRLEVYVHTAADIAIRVGLGARLPKSQLRFAGLVGDILAGGGGGAAPADGTDGRPLLEARPMTLGQLVGEICPSVTVGMSRAGKPGTFKEAAEALLAGGGRRRAAGTAEAGGRRRGGEGGVDGGGASAAPCLVVGAFQRGGFSRRTAGLLDRTVSVGEAGLEAHVVVSRALYEYEKALDARPAPR